MEEKKNIAHGYTIVENHDANPPVIEQLGNMEGWHDNGEIAYDYTMRGVGEMIWTNEEAKREFTDSKGRVHHGGEVDPITGKLILL